MALGMLLGAAGCAMQPAGTAAATAPETITVNATATEEVTPDRFIISIGVNKRADTADAVREQGNAAVNAMIETLQGLGVAQEKIRTSDINLYPNYSYDNYGNQNLAGYRFACTLEVTAEDAEVAGRVIDDSIAVGGNVLQSISYEVSDQTARYEKLLAQAVTEAREKADLMANAAGKAVNGVQSIIEQNDRYSYANEMTNPDTAGTASDTGTTVMAGTQEIQASVTVVFYLTALETAPTAK